MTLPLQARVAAVQTSASRVRPPGVTCRRVRNSSGGAGSGAAGPPAASMLPAWPAPPDGPLVDAPMLSVDPIVPAEAGLATMYAVTVLPVARKSRPLAALGEGKWSATGLGRVSV